MLCFRKSRMTWRDNDPVLKDSEDKVLTADMTVTTEDDEGIKTAYRFFLDKVYRALVNGKCFHLGRAEVKADDVPEFMVECAVRGLSCK